MIDRSPVDRRFERRIGRLLIGATYLAVGLLLVGVTLMVAGGISPLDGGPELDPDRFTSVLSSASPAGFLWLGLLVVIATPLVRVLAAAIGFARAGDRRMALVAAAILVVVASGIVFATAGSG